MIDIPKFDSIKERNKWLVTNKSDLLAQKKAETKHADGVGCLPVLGSFVSKAKVNTSDAKDDLQVKAIINTTNILDSHGDVHIPGLWSKSISENKLIMHVREHQSQKFDHIISSGNDLKVSAITYKWSDLGFDFEGKTEALQFDSTVKRERNGYMFDQYSKGYVTNHSVGMRYVKLALALNDEDESEEFAVWNKYINDIANKEEAEKQGYFWAVIEAKVIEGSAVPLGSNTATPTLEVKEEPRKHSEDDKQAAQALAAINIFLNK